MKAIRLILVALLWALSTTAMAGPPPFNPARMSGQPRPEPRLDAGTVTVRCLGKAGFSAPQVGLEVTLAVRSSDGKMESFKAKTQEEGRATFSELKPYIGGSAIASAEIGGTRMNSQPMRLLPSSGTAVLLVEGADPGPKPKTSGRAPEIPNPGTAFPLKGTPKGSLTIGTYDLAAKKAIAGVEVTLTITPPGGEPVTQTGKTDAQGKFVFKGLEPPNVPEGAQLTVEGTLRDVLRKSDPFTMDPTAGMAVVLAEGAENFQQPTEAPPQQRTQLPGPRRSSKLKAGTVDVLVVDANDQPVEGQVVSVIKRTASGIAGKFSGETGKDGRAQIKNIELQQDAGYFVETIYSSAPYKTAFFFMDKRGGVQAAMRVFETTNDPKMVRSGVKFDIDERENDMAQIVQIYDVVVQGDKAFWDPNLQIEAPPDAKGLTLIRRGEENLTHEDKAPFVTLSGPIPPGQVTDFSMAYLLPHDGTVRLTWSPPFEVVEALIFVGPTLTLTAKGSEKQDIESPIPDKTVHTLPAIALGSMLELEMAGLKIRDPRYRQVGWIFGTVIGLFALLAIAMHGRQTPQQRLNKQRVELLGRLDANPNGPDRERIVRTLDRVYRQLEALATIDKPKPKPKPKPKKEA